MGEYQVEYLEQTALAFPVWNKDSFGAFFLVEKNICNLNIFKEKVKFCFKKTKTHSWQRRDPLHEDCEATPQVILQGPQMVGVEYLSPSTQNHCDG